MSLSFAKTPRQLKEIFTNLTSLKYCFCCLSCFLSNASSIIGTDRAGLLGWCKVVQRGVAERVRELGPIEIVHLLEYCVLIGRTSLLMLSGVTYPLLTIQPCTDYHSLRACRAVIGRTMFLLVTNDIAM